MIFIMNLMPKYYIQTDMNLRQLEAFRMVMETGSVTQAGKLLYISQPAVSRLIADLEEHVNFRLFDRRKKRLIPTLEAKLLYDEVEKAFIGLSSIEDTAQSILELKRGHLRLIAMPGIATLLLPKVINEFSLQFPNIKIELESRTRLQVMEWISSHQYDLGFANLPLEGSDVELHSSFPMEMVCVVPKMHSLANRSSISPSDLKEENFISYPRGTHIRFAVDQAFENSKINRHIKVEARSSEAILNLVSTGFGVSVVPRFSNKSLGSEALSFIPLIHPIMMQLGVFVQAGKYMSITSKHFVETFSKYMKNS